MQSSFGFVITIAAVLLLVIPSSYGNLRARAFYALTNHPNGDIINIEPPSMEAIGLDEQPSEPLVFLQNAGNDPRCIFCRSGLGKRMSIEIRNPSFNRRA